VCVCVCVCVCLNFYDFITPLYLVIFIHFRPLQRKFQLYAN